MRLSIATSSFLLMLLAGCGPLVCPFHDEFVVYPAPTTTASVDGIRASNAPPAMRQRGHAPTERLPESGIVAHGPLYFEDPFEDKGSEDGQFAWTGEDYLWMVYWRGRFLLNAIALPVSAVVTPPWIEMCSDGRLSRQALGYDHDAERCADRCRDEPPRHQESSSAGG